MRIGLAMALSLAACGPAFSPINPIEPALLSPVPRQPKVWVGESCSLSYERVESLDPEGVTYGPACMRVNVDMQSSLAFATIADTIRTNAFALDGTACDEARAAFRTIVRRR